MFQGYLTFKAGVSLEIVGDFSSQGKNGATGTKAGDNWDEEYLTFKIVVQVVIP